MSVSRIGKRGQETFGGDAGRPGFPGRAAVFGEQRVGGERPAANAEYRAHFFGRPTGDVHRFAGGGEAVGFLVAALFLVAPGGQAVAQEDGLRQAFGQRREGVAEDGFERRDGVEADQALFGVVQEFAQGDGGGERFGRHLAAQGQDQDAVLGDRQGARPDRMAAPAEGPRQADGQVAVVPVEGRGVEQVEPLSGGLADPGAGGLLTAHLDACGGAVFTLEQRL